ncbi:VpsF family polysaccharide biosynthesis protein [Methylobacterium sp. A54F]
MSLLARAETAAFLLMSLVLMGVSGGMLWVLGLNYDGLTGSAAQKIHPATYLAVALFGLALARAGNPVAYLAEVGRARPASAFIALVGVVFLVFIAARGGTGLAGALDVYMLAGLVVILMLGRDARTLRRLELIVHGTMLANALLGLFEFVSGQRFFPFRLDGLAFETDTRSAALMGHPLANATLTACYILALATGGGRLTPILRAGMIGLQLAALITFGGRSATVATVLLGGAYGFLALNRALARGRIPILAAAAGAFLLTLVPIAVGGLAVGGFFDALLERFASDGGSANARVEMLEIFQDIPFRDLLVGPDATLIDTLRRMYGLEWGIENPIVRTLLYHGVFMTVLLIVAVALFLTEVARQCRRGVWLPMLAFVGLVNTFEGLGGKSTLLAKFAMMLLVLYPVAVERISAPRPLAASAGRGRR